MKLKFLSSGESHGKCLNAIIDGIPANFEISVEKINDELTKRQMGYGRGGRMQIEKDKVIINSGIRFGKTIGSPICLEIQNKDYENWKTKMSTEKVDLSDNDILQNILEAKITKVRPGHADLAGAIKYNQTDVRNILERSSARETAIKVAVGAIAKQILEKFNINIESQVLAIGNVEAKNFDENEQNDLNCKDKAAYELMKQEIDKAKEQGVTLGGLVQIKITGLPIGLGSHVNWARRLDGNLARAIMSIQAVKSVEIGLGKQVAFLNGNQVHDEIFYENGKIIRKTNNAGGIEGGMSNGEPVIITFAMKPIPTMKTSLSSIDIETKEPIEAHFERSDTCAVSACGIVAENMSAIIILNEFLEKFGGDSFEEISANYENYMNIITERLQ